MAVTIVATAGSASANSFTTLAAAESYLEGRLPSPTTWDAATGDTKNRALVSATRWLTTLAWRGRVAASDQALAWPRQGVPDPDALAGTYLATDTIPTRVVNATIELALAMVDAGTTDIAALDSTIGIKRKRIDVIETEYFDPHQRARDLDRFPAVKRPIAVLLSPAAARGALTVIRG